MRSDRPLSTREIADSVGINRKLAFHHLLDLSKNKKLVKSNEMSPAFWFTRESHLMVSKKMKVFGIIKNSGKITAKNISKLTGIKEGVVFWALKELEKENIIKKTGSIQISIGPPSVLWST